MEKLIFVVILFFSMAYASAPIYESDIVQAANMYPCSTSHFCATDSIDTLRNSDGTKMNSSQCSKALYLSADIDSDFMYVNPINSNPLYWVLTKCYGGNWIPIESRRIKMSPNTKHPGSWWEVLK